MSIVAFSLTSSLFSQYHDFKIWTGAKANKKLDDHFTLIGRVQGRFGQNITLMEKYFAEFGTKYKVNDFYSPAVKYRLSNFGILNTQRIDLDNNFNYSRFNDKLSLRVRFQHRIVNQTQFTKNRLRFRIGYAHKFSKKLSVYAKAEYFYTMYFKFNGWNQQRFTVGGKRRIYKNHYADVFYRYESEYNAENPEHSYILGLMYVYNFK